MAEPVAKPRIVASDESEVDLGDLERTLGFLLRMAQVRVYEQFFRHFDGTEVKPGEFTVLRVIGGNPGVRQGTLARVLNIKPAHMTKLVHRLVTSGLIERATPPEDRRAVELQLTAKGSEFVARHLPDFETVHAAERIGLSQTEERQLLGLLHKLAFKDLP
jgi:DNA-binding MarR family transcriptional regulator